MSPFRRDISPNERLYLAGERLSPPLSLQLFVEGTGHVGAASLERAVAEASRACPGAQLVARGREWVDSGEAPPVRAAHSGSFDGSRFDAAFLRQRFDARRGPTCEVLLLDGDRTTLVFRASHGVMDGRGVLLWARDVFRALRGERPEGAASPLSDLGLLEKLGAVEKRRPLELDCLSPAGSMKVTDTEFFWRRQALPGSHAALVAKLGALISEAAAPRRLRFMVPVDMRRHDPALSSTANLSLPIFLDVERGTRWEELHERVLAALAGKRELASEGSERAILRMPVPALSAFLRATIQLQRLRGRYLLGSGILSHLGRVDTVDFSAGGFAASSVYSLPVHAPLAALSVVAVECPEHVELCWSFPRGDGMEERADALLGSIADAFANRGARTWAGNLTDAPFASDRTVTQLFRERAAAAPHAVALVCGGRETTYAELDRRAGALARALRDRGVEPGAVVGLFVDRTEDAPASVLGILEAGAAYLPIDPGLPDERVAYMLADAKATACVSGERYATRLAGVFPGQVLVPHRDDPGEVDRVAEAGVATDLAYVIYTSGSTGQPKGVQIEHRSLINYVEWATAAYGVDATTRFALFTSLSFDLTATALFLPLLAGGSVTLIPEELDHVTLENVLTRSGATALKLTPTHLDLMGRLGVTPAGFRTIVVGGEQLRGAVAGRAQEMFGPGCRIINEYGPTEATIGCVYHVFDAAKDGGAPAVPIGIPGKNTRVYLLDPEQKDVEQGEAHIAGDGLARGYLGREDLDREKFVRLAGGARAYRSGDLVKLRPDGALEYCGRIDDQIKIRGHRIEPGEIEAALEEHPAVARAKVVGRARPGQDEKVLCAYLVCRSPASDVELRAYLQKRLPVYMSPAFFVAVSDIPLTVNGKVDVRALPDPFEAPHAGERVEPPRGERDPIEAAVSAIWSEVLGVAPQKLGPDADFYRLGGDSLQMVEMLSLVARKVVGKRSEGAFMRDIRPVIGNPTLENVCRAAKSGRRAAHGASGMMDLEFRAARPGDADQVVPLIYESSKGLYDYSFRFGDEGPSGFIRHDFLRGKGIMGHENQYVAVTPGGEVVATTTAYRGRDFSRLTVETTRSAMGHFSVTRFLAVSSRSVSVAGLFVKPRADGIFIANACVPEHHRGKGLFSALFEHVLGTFEGQGIKAVELDVSFSNTGAQRLYERLGFKVMGEKPYKGKHAVEGFRRMAKALP